MCHPSQEMAQLSQVPQIENGKPDFSPTFQKVELRNSTFFQPLFTYLMLKNKNKPRNLILHWWETETITHLQEFAENTVAKI